MNSSEKKIRPDLLTWLCLGSATFGFLWIIMFIVLIAFSVNGDVPSGLFPAIVISYLQAGYAFIIAEIFLTAIGLAGVILMWQMKKTGFYLYAIVKGSVYFLPVVYIGYDQLNFFSLILTSMLILAYGTLFTGKPDE